MFDQSVLAIGSKVVTQPSILAPMAGVTDEPFRQLCLKLGAGLAVSEMVTSDQKLWSSRKSQQRLLSIKSADKHNSQSPNDALSNEIKSVQLIGNEPEVMAKAAYANQVMGADIIDINMGCPAKKVCKKAAGSALLRDEALVSHILSAVVNAVDIPVTLKIRTGWNPQERNGTTIAKIAEQAGISALAVHGRTRACAFKGEVEYDTIAEIVDAVSIPVFANGDINSPEKAKQVLEYTGAQAVMIGRAAQGNPWIFREINHYLATGTLLAKPTPTEVYTTLSQHLDALHQFYGELMGVRIARKHVGWYLTKQTRPQHIQHEYNQFRQTFNRLEVAQDQHRAIKHFFDKQLLTIEESKEEIAA